MNAQADYRFTSIFPQADVEGVAQGVAEEAEAEHDEEDGRAGRTRYPMNASAVGPLRRALAVDDPAFSDEILTAVARGMRKQLA